MSKSRTAKNNLNIPSHQHNDYVPQKTETVAIQSASVPLWGNSFTIDLREKDVLVQELILQFNLSAITGTALVGAKYVPAQFFIDHIDYSQSGKIIDTFYPTNQFLTQQLFCYDEDRFVANCAAGVYSSPAQRIAMAANQNMYYLPLFDFFKQAKGSMPLLEANHAVQLRVFLQPLANVISVTSGTVPTGSIIACNMLMKCIRLREQEVTALKNDMVKSGALSFKYTDLKPQISQVVAGSASYSINLQSLTGPCAFIYFVVRPTNGLTGENQFAYLPILSYEIANSSGTNIIGGQAITASQAQLIDGNRYSKSTYFAETALGLTDNKANVYMYSFTADPEAAIREGVSNGSYTFTGAEVLKINFPSALATACQIDIHCYTESVISMTRTSVTRQQFHA